MTQAPNVNHNQLIVDVNTHEHNRAERLRKQQEGWQIKSQKHWHPRRFGCTQEHFRTHTTHTRMSKQGVEGKKKKTKKKLHQFIQAFCLVLNLLWLQSLTLLIHDIKSSIRQWWARRTPSTLKRFAFSQRRVKKRCRKWSNRMVQSISGFPAKWSQIQYENCNLTQLHCQHFFHEIPKNELEGFCFFHLSVLK